VPEVHDAGDQPRPRVKTKNNVLPFPSLQLMPRDPPPRRYTVMHGVLALALFGAAFVLAALAVCVLVP